MKLHTKQSNTQSLFLHYLSAQVNVILCSKVYTNKDRCPDTAANGT